MDRSETQSLLQRMLLLRHNAISCHISRLVADRFLYNALREIHWTIDWLTCLGENELRSLEEKIHPSIHRFLCQSRRVASSSVATKCGATQTRPAPWEAITTFTNFCPHLPSGFPRLAIVRPIPVSSHLPTCLSACPPDQRPVLPIVCNSYYRIRCNFCFCLLFFFSVSELRQLGLGAWLTVKVSRKKWTQSCSWPT